MTGRVSINAQTDVFTSAKNAKASKIVIPVQNYRSGCRYTSALFTLIETLMTGVNRPLWCLSSCVKVDLHNLIRESQSGGLFCIMTEIMANSVGNIRLSDFQLDINYLTRMMINEVSLSIGFTELTVRTISMNDFLPSYLLQNGLALLQLTLLIDISTIF